MNIATYFVTSALLVTLAMTVNARPRIRRRLAGLKETQMVFSENEAISKEILPKKGRVLEKLLGLRKDDSRDRKLRPTPATVITSPSDLPGTDEDKYDHSERAANGTDRQEVKRRKRVRRRCYPTVIWCTKPTKPSRKQKLPKRAHH